MTIIVAITMVTTNLQVVYVDHKVLGKPVVCFMRVVNRSVQFECCVIASSPYSKPLMLPSFFLSEKGAETFCEKTFCQVGFS